MFQDVRCICTSKGGLSNTSRGTRSGQDEAWTPAQKAALGRVPHQCARARDESRAWDRLDNTLSSTGPPLARPGRESTPCNAVAVSAVCLHSDLCHALAASSMPSAFSTPVCMLPPPALPLSVTLRRLPCCVCPRSGKTPALRQLLHKAFSLCQSVRSFLRIALALTYLPPTPCCSQ